MPIVVKLPPGARQDMALLARMTVPGTHGPVMIGNVDGAPVNSLMTLVLYLYNAAFKQVQYGYAAAYATVIFGILLIYGNLQNRVTRATEGV